MIKLIASDMDGTLLNNEHEISKGNLEAIRKVQESGRHFTIVTGRDYGAVKPFLDKYDLKCECILSNGAEYRDKNGNVIESIHINKDSVREIIDIINEEELCIQIMTNKGPYITNKEGDRKAIIDRFKLFSPNMTQEEVIEFVEKFEKERGMNYINDANDILVEDIEILKIVTFDNDVNLIKRLKEKLKNNIKGLAVASTFSNDIEISDSEAQKGLILAKTIKKMGIKKEEVIVLGDSFNDYSMFTEFENSFAMENAIPEIKEIAKYITETNNNDGVAKAIYKVLEWN